MRFTSTVLRKNSHKDTMKPKFINIKWLIIPKKSELKTKLDVNIRLN
jgi:hypothetical protein